MPRFAVDHLPRLRIHGTQTCGLPSEGRAVPMYGQPPLGQAVDIPMLLHSTLAAVQGAKEGRL